MRPLDRKHLEKLLAGYLKDMIGVTGKLTLTVNIHQGSIGGKVGVGFMRTLDLD